MHTKRMKTIGLIGGMSWESTALYYKYLNELARDRLGGLHSAKIILYSFDFAEIEKLQVTNDWNQASDKMKDAAKSLERAGADCLIICTNTMHKLADIVQDSVSIPLVHIADATASAIHKARLHKPLLLATRYTMEQNFYRDRLNESYHLDPIIPNKRERNIIHSIIYNELCKGIIEIESKNKYHSIINRYKDEGADSVILGCTEIGLLVQQREFKIPVFDTTFIHAQAIMEHAMY